jgi:hypothetical protein
MGIYSDGNIYGIVLSLEVDSFFTDIYNKVYPTKMNCEQIQEAKAVYDKLTINEKYRLTIRFYTSCSSTYNESCVPFMSWFPGTIGELEKLFSESDIHV